MEETQVRFVIPASEAESMAQKANLPSVLHLLPSLVPSAQRLARTPISNFHVGAVGIGGVSGRVFLGVNVEFLNLPLNYSIHAEQFLLTNLSLNAEPSLSHFAVSAAPCGHCRQFYQELRNASSLNVLVADTDLPTATAFTPLSHFLPHRFGPENLLSKHLPFLLEPHHNGLSFLTNSQPNGLTATANNFDSLRYAALDAANKSHAPYSGCPSGVALIDTDGNIHKGSYAESAAYNPSIGPAQAALVAYIANGGGHGYEKIVAAVLVETESAIVKQEHAARLLFQTISPKCEFKVSLCVGGTKRPSSI
ncbi:cytidine deaminase 1 [Quercus suber]|nr:cytidine deaminase 1-like [Quercus suber]POE69852.1 cytidine deaminase 1 [Quercus suber]